jgi:hypothetical protein
MSDVVPVLDPIPVDPTTIRRGWSHTALIALAILVPALGLSLPGFAITMAIGMAMVFAGPVYAAFYVPIAIRKWRKKTDAGVDGPERDLIVSFGTLNQKLTLMLSGLLMVNLIVVGGAYLNRNEGGSEFLILYGSIAVCAGIPIFLVNLAWIRRTNAIPSENIAVRNRLGAWRLITVNRALSLVVWCGYPVASIIGIISSGP